MVRMGSRHWNRQAHSSALPSCGSIGKNARCRPKGVNVSSSLVATPAAPLPTGSNASAPMRVSTDIALARASDDGGSMACNDNGGR